MTLNKWIVDRHVIVLHRILVINYVKISTLHTEPVRTPDFKISNIFLSQSFNYSSLIAKLLEFQLVSCYFEP